MTDRELFRGALDIPEPTDRERFLIEQCGENAALRRRVERMLAAHPGTATFAPDAPLPTADYFPTDAPGLVLAGAERG